jgi:ubiquinone/menaquinone biosynthesis C-methylase UbiE
MFCRLWKMAMTNQHAGHLGDVYAAKDTDAVARLYDAWSESYDAEMAKFGYRHPSICLALLSRHLPKGAAPLLDAGAGTGLIGEWLSIMGYDTVEALDVSPGMLAVAQKKGCYKALHHLALGRDLPFADGAYAGIVAAGVFTTGHVGPEGLDELVRICRKGGVIVLTVKGTLWDNHFRSYTDELVLAKRVSVVEITVPYVSMPWEAATTPSLGLVLRVN